MNETALAWAILVLGYLLPLLHVALSPAAGSWRPPPGARCPLGPRVGWLVMVLLLGAVGWLLFMLSRLRRGHTTGP
jgi:hypothetical protein